MASLDHQKLAMIQRVCENTVYLHDRTGKIQASIANLHYLRIINLAKSNRSGMLSLIYSCHD